MLVMPPCWYLDTNMFIEAIVDGVVKKVWHKENEILAGSGDELGYQRRQLRWQAIETECRIEMGEVGMDYDRCKIVFNIKSHMSAKDISVKEMTEFNLLVLHNIQKRKND